MNSSSSSLTFTLYGSLGLYGVALLVCVLVLYVSGLCVNVLLVVVICARRRLHRPMYVLLVHLAVSGVAGSSSVCPLILRLLLAAGRQSSVSGCLTQAFFSNMYGGCVFCILALMAYDRYVCVCQPLRYHSIMTAGRLRLLLLLLYAALGGSSALQVFLTSRLTLCSHTVDKLLCDSVLVSSLSCQRTAVVGVFGLSVALAVIALPCLLVILSYAHILAVVLNKQKECRRRALHTCTPHLVTFVNFSVATFFGFVSNRLSHDVPKAVNIFTCINFFLVPPLLHPIIYGMKMQEIRHSVTLVLRGKHV